jgi:outer membrane receptor protein involved in Fe transport
VRAAVFRVLKRTLITDQTLEPTQVAGFNQFYDDRNATDAWRYGVAIDQKFSKNIFGGLEFAYRDLDVPGIQEETFITEEHKAKEYLGRAYLFWTPHDWLSLRAEYLFERFDNELELLAGNEPLELDTHRVPVGINFFHPSGLSASLTTTYINQDGEFQTVQTGELLTGSDDFWTVDAAINFRLPKRYGIITVGATNLLDEKFKYFEVDFDNPRLIPDRQIFARATISLP